MCAKLGGLSDKTKKGRPPVTASIPVGMPVQRPQAPIKGLNYKALEMLTIQYEWNIFEKTINCMLSNVLSFW